MTYDEIQRLQKQIGVMSLKVSKYHRLYQQASGKAMRYARTRDTAVQDKIFLKRKIWAVLSVLPSDANWHNAPDYIICLKAQGEVDAKEANRYRTICENLQKNSMSLANVQEMAHSIMTMFAPTITQDYVNKFIEEWRRNNDC